jgi:hypothetical protein
MLSPGTVRRSAVLQRARRLLSQKTLPPASEQAAAAASRGDGSSTFLALGGCLCVAAAVAYATQYSSTARKPTTSETTVSNWSNTHEVTTANYHTPESVEELEALVAAAHAGRTKLRPVGSGLSPNGLGFCAGGMVNLALCDKARCTHFARRRRCPALPPLPQQTSSQRRRPPRGSTRSGLGA